MKNLVTAIAAAAAVLATSVASLAETYTLGDLVIENPQARATTPGQPVSAGFMVIHNNGAESDYLVGGATDFADMVQVHEMAMQGDVMKMRELANGLEIPAGGEVTLKPGGFHVMFMKMKKTLEAGSTEKVTLRFKNAGEITIDFAVVSRDMLQNQMNMNKNMNMN